MGDFLRAAAVEAAAGEEESTWHYVTARWAGYSSRPSPKRMILRIRREAKHSSAGLTVYAQTYGAS